MTERAKLSLPASYFDALYAADPDPWAFETSDYERAKYQATVDALGAHHYRTALEVGCSIGVLTERLAPHCDWLLGIDASALALNRARARCGHLPGVRFAERVLPAGWPHGCYDLIVLSEVLYYFDPPDLERVAGLVGRDIAAGGVVVLVHWTGETDYPLSGDEAVERFVAALPELQVTMRRREPAYRLETLRRSG